MTHAAHDYFVYGCVACGKRIFTKRSHVGRLGTCPCCDVEHRVGGENVVSKGSDRRVAPRVKPAGTKIQLVTGHSDHAELFALEDLSETGFSFRLAGVRDGKQLSGVSAPIEVGAQVSVTVRGSALGGRAYAAEVRRVVPPSRGGGLYLVGAAFTGLTELQRADLKELVERLLDTD